MDALAALGRHGQSYWMDNLTRTMIGSGELARRVREEDLRGITSNPKIFKDAITDSDAYDDQIAALAAEGAAPEAIYEALVVKDVQDACDILGPAFGRTRGLDGFVSLEVSPHLAHDAGGTLAEARRLHAAVDRPNVLIKIPGTTAGLAAIEAALAEGINVNVTLLFAVPRYEDVARAYLRALTHRVAAGQPIDGIASVASFFLSRIDTLVDQLVAQHFPRHAAPAHLLGRAAVANAKIAYQRFRALFAGDDWEALRAAGGRVQRLLWASTSTKNPTYRDVCYVEPLIGADTVTTMPEETIAAFAHHGEAAPTLERDLDEAQALMAELDQLGIDLHCATTQLLNEGVQKFIEPYDELLDAIAAQAKRVPAKPAAAR